MRRLVIGNKCREGHMLTAKTLRIYCPSSQSARYREQRSCRICNANRSRELRLGLRTARAEIIANMMPLDYWETWI